MPKLIIEIDDTEATVVTRVTVDGEPVGAIQTLKFEANPAEVSLEAVLPDCDVGWRNAEILKKLPYCQPFLCSLEGE